MHFFHSIWKNLHLTENFYTDMSVVSVTNKGYDTTLGRTLFVVQKNRESAGEGHPKLGLRPIQSYIQPKNPKSKLQNKILPICAFLSIF